jgi:hypothetical protein
MPERPRSQSVKPPHCRLHGPIGEAAWGCSMPLRSGAAGVNPVFSAPIDLGRVQTRGQPRRRKRMRVRSTATRTPVNRDQRYIQLSRTTSVTVPHHWYRGDGTAVVCLKADLDIQCTDFACCPTPDTCRRQRSMANPANRKTSVRVLLRHLRRSQYELPTTQAGSVCSDTS